MSDLQLYSDAASARTAMKGAKPNSELLEWFSETFNSYRYVLDFGAGHGRHATALREMGHKVYAYDPFNGTEENGWKGVSNKLPATSTFEVVFSTYVLNTTTLANSYEVVEMMERSITKRGGHVVHIVRRDLSVEEQLTSRGTYQRCVYPDFFWDRGYEPEGNLWLKRVKRDPNYSY